MTGERLYLSVKTVDHHVSAILSKLQVTERRDAVKRARELGIVS
ncbi:MULTISPECIES: LuxR C-terminal-related transcriptional regulator [unclassified Mycobacterium]|nr:MULTISPECIES: LuxR C-terminal-related transcriptional regulator [unclassified Mycobacterium]